MKPTRIATMLGSTAVFTVSQMVTSIAWAQDAGTGTAADVTVLDTILVSGEKISRSLQETASSVEIITGRIWKHGRMRRMSRVPFRTFPTSTIPVRLALRPLSAGRIRKGRTLARSRFIQVPFLGRPST